jgi:H+/gluconate symporter-like permease
MKLLYSVFFGAGLAAFIYTKMSRRTGYGNERPAWIITGVIFVIATLFFFSIMVLFIPK